MTEFVRQDRVKGGERVKFFVNDQVTVLLFALWRRASKAPSVSFPKTFDRDFSVFWDSALEHDVIQNFSPALTIRNCWIVGRG